MVLIIVSQLCHFSHPDLPTIEKVKDSWFLL
uniref:Uncharacterized protein n=1 Tax=Lepeophtheirus salmonis TaxID=72036 RepID=A0A0K2UUW1_LEPSM